MSAITGCVDGTGGAFGAIQSMVAVLRHRAVSGRRIWRIPGAEFGAIGRSAQQAVPTDSEGPIAILDGYIANEAELAAALGIVGSGEALLAAGYERWGSNIFARLAGGFAIAIWDQRTRRMLLARDPLGVKPLYFYSLGDALVFGSEPKAIFVHPGCERRLDWNRIDILLQPRLGDAWETPLVGLNQVRPGHFVEFGNSTLRERRFWSLTSMPHEDDYPTTVEKVRALLKSSVDGATADFESGLAMLSGGIDSTAVAALAGSRVADSFCLRFAGERDDFSASELRPDIDAPFAIEAATWLGMHHHEVELDTDDILSAIPATRRARDLPGWGQFDASMYSLFETMSGYGAQGLSGEAADELFGGYPFFFDDAAISRANFPWLGLGLRLADFVHPEARARSNDALDADQRYCRLLANVPRLADESDAAARMRELFYLGLQGPLNIVLERKDRMSAACGLDLRLPFCDHRLVDYVWNVPWQFKSHRGIKGLLKDAVRDVVPPSTLNRRKSAYPHSQSEAYHSALIAETLVIADGPDEGARALFSAAALRDLVGRLTGPEAGKAYPGGADPRYLLVHVVELHRWLIDQRITVQ